MNQPTPLVTPVTPLDAALTSLPWPQRLLLGGQTQTVTLLCELNERLSRLEARCPAARPCGAPLASVLRPSSFVRQEAA